MLLACLKKENVNNKMKQIFQKSKKYLSSDNCTKFLCFESDLLPMLCFLSLWLHFLHCLTSSISAKFLSIKYNNCNEISELIRLAFTAKSHKANVLLLNSIFDCFKEILNSIFDCFKSSRMCFSTEDFSEVSL